MKVHTALQSPRILFILSAILISGLLAYTYIVNSKKVESRDNQETRTVPVTELDASDLESETTPASPKTELEQATPSHDTQDTVSAGQRATSNSQTSITISNSNTEQVNTTVSLKISENGCMIEANGPNGTQLVVDAKNDKKGGQQTYSLTGSPISVSSGGMLSGMQVEARIVDPSGSIKATATATIGSSGCPN